MPQLPACLSRRQKNGGGLESGKKAKTKRLGRVPADAASCMLLARSRCVRPMTSGTAIIHFEFLGRHM